MEGYFAIKLLRIVTANAIQGDHFRSANARFGHALNFHLAQEQYFMHATALGLNACFPKGKG